MTARRILRTVQKRLHLVNDTFKALQHQAQNAGRLLLETEPSTPAPNRRLLIIRTDVAPSPTTLMLEGLVPRMENFNASLDLPPPALNADGGIDAIQLIEKLNLADNDPDQARKKGSIFRSLLGSRSPKPGSSPRTDGSQSPSCATREAVAAASAAFQTSSSMSPRSSIYQQRPSHHSHHSRTTTTANTNTSHTRKSNEQSDFKEGYFKFSLELVDKHKGPPRDIVYHRYPPKLPVQWQALLDDEDKNDAYKPGRSSIESSSKAVDVQKSSRYAGMALAEWHLVVNECQNFFERRRREGVPANRLVETPTLGVESLKRPG